MAMSHEHACARVTSGMGGRVGNMRTRLHTLDKSCIHVDLPDARAPTMAELDLVGLIGPRPEPCDFDHVHIFVLLLLYHAHPLLLPCVVSHRDHSPDLGALDVLRVRPQHGLAQPATRLHVRRRGGASRPRILRRHSLEGRDSGCHGNRLFGRPFNSPFDSILDQIEDIRSHFCSFASVRPGTHGRALPRPPASRPRGALACLSAAPFQLMWRGVRCSPGSMSSSLLSDRMDEWSILCLLADTDGRINHTITHTHARRATVPVLPLALPQFPAKSKCLYVICVSEGGEMGENETDQER